MLEWLKYLFRCVIDRKHVSRLCIECEENSEELIYVN